MSATELAGSEPEYVTLTFSITFPKTEIVLAPGGSSHPIKIICIRPNFVHDTVHLGPPERQSQEEAEARTHDLQHYIQKASEGRALLAAALALFDAHFARTLSQPDRLPPPPRTDHCA